LRDSLKKEIFMVCGQFHGQLKFLSLVGFVQDVPAHGLTLKGHPHHLFTTLLGMLDD